MPQPEQVYGPNATILITGASSGIGATLAVHLARYGGRLALQARRAERLAQVAEAVEKRGATALVLAGDVVDPEGVAEQHRQLTAALGPVDVAFLNAGVGDPVSLTRFSAARVRRLFEVNVFGVAHWLEAILPDMITRRRGVVAVTSSIAALRGVPGSGAYSASKAAVSTLAEALRVEGAPHNIQVTTIEPGFVRSEMTDRDKRPKPFLVETEEAVRAVADGVAAGRRVIRFPWQMTAAMSLVRGLPAPLFDRLGRLMVKR